LTTIPVEARGLDALEQAFAIMARERVQAFVMQGDSVLFNYRNQIVEMALKNRLPAASIQKELAEAGFLLTYGADLRDVLSWSRLSEQNLRIDKWSVCRGYAARRSGSGVK
jgi:putative ABC transport system substrate-binding protein